MNSAPFLTQRLDACLRAVQQGHGSDWPLRDLRRLEAHGLLTIVIRSRFPGGASATWTAGLTHAGHLEAEGIAARERRTA